MNSTKYLFLCAALVTQVYGFTQQELADSAFNYFFDHIKTIDELQVNVILQEVDIIVKRDGLDKNLVLQQLSDRVQKQIQYHAHYIRGKWNHPSMKIALLSAAAGLGCLGLGYLAYKKWYAPLNTEFDTLAQDLKHYGVRVQEEEYTTHPAYNHTIYHHIVNYRYVRQVSDAEREMAETMVDKLVDIRKRQDWLSSYLGVGGFFGTVISFVIGGQAAQEVYECDYAGHKLHYEKYQMILKQISN